MKFYVMMSKISAYFLIGAITNVFLIVSLILNPEEILKIFRTSVVSNIFIWFFVLSCLITMYCYLCTKIKNLIECFINEAIYATILSLDKSKSNAFGIKAKLSTFDIKINELIVIDLKLLVKVNFLNEGYTFHLTIYFLRYRW